MEYSPETAATILKMAEDVLKGPDAPPARLKRLWWTLLSVRGRSLTNGLRLITGDKVCGGPFKGMTLTEEALNAYRAPILLGCYEQELHPAFEKAFATPYTRILNIGCSVGYYAAGFALRMPQAIVEAFDIDAQARQKCAAMSRINKVEDRVRISDRFHGEAFANYGDEKTLVLMDIEGGEVDLLDPARYPALMKMDVIVELHDLMHPAISKTVCDRFASSHSVELVKNRNFLPDVSGVLHENQLMDPFDQLLLGWEGRGGPTPWGIFISNS